MRHGGDHDVSQMVIDKAVEHFTARAFACHHARGLEDAQVLAHQRLRHPESVDEFVHAARRLTKLQHDRDPHRRGERAKQVTRGVEHLSWRHIRERGIAVLVVVIDLRREGGNRFHYVRHDTCVNTHVNGVSVCCVCCGEVRVNAATSASIRLSPVASIIDTVANLAKRRGLVYQSGEIYGGTKSAWDYGPLGVELKENIKRQWWRSVVTSRDDVVGLDSAIILPREVWVASGHVEVFNDPLVECLNCHKRHRQDHMQEAYAEKKGIDDPDSVAMSEIACPDCGTKGQWTEPRDFNMMLKTYLGPIETEEGMHYLRPETAQGIFVNFANVVTTSRRKPPFGIGQIGKSFRNEITPGNFIFRTREFEQMEMEFFVEPDSAREWHQYWIDTRLAWYVDLGIARDNLRLFEHPKEKLSHYSDRTVDIEYKFGFQGNPWGELEGVANRTDFDLSTHSKHSGVDLSFYDQATDTRYVPYVIEPAAGLTRSFMAFLVDAYSEDEAPNAKGGVDKRTVLRLDPRLAPVKAAVLPLSRNEDLSPKARDLAAELRKFVERRIRRRRCDRSALSPPGRDRYAVLCDGRLRHARRPRRHDPRTGCDVAGTHCARRRVRLPRGATQGRLTVFRRADANARDTPCDTRTLRLLAGRGEPPRSGRHRRRARRPIPNRRRTSNSSRRPCCRRARRAWSRTGCCRG